MTHGATVVVGVGVEGFVFIVTTDRLRSCGAAEVNWKKGGSDGPEEGWDTRVLSWRRRFILSQGGPA